MMQLVRFCIPVSVVHPTIVYVEYYVTPTFDQLTGKRSAIVFSIGGPSPSMDVDYNGKIFCTLGREDIIFERLHSWFRENHILGFVDIFNESIFDKYRSDRHILTYRYFHGRGKILIARSSPLATLNSIINCI